MPLQLSSVTYYSVVIKCLTLQRPIYRAKPYVFFSWDSDPKRYKGIIEKEGYFTFIWSSPMQRMTKLEETSLILIREFEALWNSIDTNIYLGKDR